MGRFISEEQQRRDHRGLRNICAADGHAGTADDPLVITTDGFRVHRSDTTDPDSGLYGTAQR